MTLPEERAAAPARRPRGIPRRAYAVLTSPRLAIALLVAVLGCCLAGVTVYRGARAWERIFSTLWFNGLLVLLALSSGAAFFSRIWKRKPSLVSVGMILFHLSFLVLLGGVVVNDLLHFKGVLRLTEGETLANGDPASYDVIETGRLFDFGRLRGQTTLLRMHRGYAVDGQDKRVAYEISVGEGDDRKTGIIYVTQNLERHGVRYLVSKEGYSIGVILHARQGPELYAGMVPLQSLQRGPDTYLYTTGTSEEPGAFPFPPPPDRPALLLQVGYVPDARQERAGRVEFSTWSATSAEHGEGQGTSGIVPVGGRLDAGDYQLEAREVRYWVGMAVRYDPGLTVILSSLWAGLGGMVMTFLGRIRQDSKREQRHASTTGEDATASRGTA